MREINKIYCDNWLNNNLPDKCAKLIIADPPYFEVKGEFDFIWKTFEDYLKDVEKWAIECKRVLADNGTLFWYGHAKNIAYSQIIFDKIFELVNNIVWEKTDCQTNKGIEYFRMFAPITERILMYQHKDEYHDIVRMAIEEVQKYLNTLTTKNELAEMLLNIGNCKNIASAKQNAHNILSQRSAKPQMITELQYDLIAKDKMLYSELAALYEIKRIEFDLKRRPFNNFKKLSDVLKFSQQANISGNYDHDTIKPEKLTRALILTCSRKDDLVVVPFAGSGTECAMSAKEGRLFIGFDIEQKHVNTSNERCKIQLQRKNDIKEFGFAKTELSKINPTLF